MTQIANVSTARPSVRSEIDGWIYEDSDLLVDRRDTSGKLEIEYTPSPRNLHHTCVLEMIADGWKLLGPPIDASWANVNGVKIPQWKWWLTKETNR